jgi:hypothetical protein
MLGAAACLGCGSSELSASRSASPAVGASQVPPQQTERVARELARLRASRSDADLVFVRMRDCALARARGDDWRSAIEHEPTATMELHCRTRSAIRTDCGKPGIAYRRFSYGDRLALHASIYEPPTKGSWGALVHIGPSRISVQFGRRAAATGALDVELQVLEYQWKVRGANRGISLPKSPGHLEALLESPESFRDAAVAKLGELAQATRSELTPGGMVRKITAFAGCVPIERPFDAAEQAELVAAADRELARSKRLLEAHFRELHALLAGLLQCDAN